MKTIKRSYAYFQALSLDVVLGSLVNTLLIANYLAVKIPYTVLFALASATWLIYTIDHLYDATKLKEKSSSFRHLFHFKNKKILIVVCFILLIINILNLFYLPVSILKIGFYMSLGVLAYFFFLRLASGQPSLFKELSIALIYTVAIFLSPLILGINNWNVEVYLLFAEYFLLALINLLEFSLFDFTLDEKEQHSSLIRKLGVQNSTQLIGLLIGISFLLVIISTIFLYYRSLNPVVFFYQIQLCIFLMNGMLAIILLFPAFFAKNDSYRIFGDMVFLFPIFLFLLSVRLC